MPGWFRPTYSPSAWCLSVEFFPVDVIILCTFGRGRVLTVCAYEQNCSQVPNLLVDLSNGWKVLQLGTPSGGRTSMPVATVKPGGRDREKLSDLNPSCVQSLDFCATHSLAIMNTKFKHKCVYTCTWHQDTADCSLMIYFVVM